MKSILSLRLMILLIVLFAACKESKPKYEALNLLTEDIPLDIYAPPDVEVNSRDIAGIMKDVTIKNNQGYSIQITESELTTLDIKTIVEDLMSDVSNALFFSTITENFDDGFIYEKKIDEDYITYDFRKVKIVGDKKYEVQAGLSTQHTLKQVEEMYSSIK